MKIINNEKGAILITMILLLVIVTLVGVIAINTATVDVQISGNLKRASMAFAGAEAGVDLSIPIIESTIAMGWLSTSSTTVSTSINLPNFTLDAAGDLGTEIAGGSDANNDNPTASPDITITNLNDVNINVDIDRLYAVANQGGAIEFAAGYEGIGAGAAGAGMGVLYKIESQGTR